MKYAARIIAMGIACAFYLGLLLSQSAVAAVSQDFESIFTTTQSDQTDGGWHISQGLRSSANPHTGTYSAEIRNNPNDYLDYVGDGNGKDGGGGVLTFWYCAAAANANFSVQYSVNGGAFTEIAAFDDPPQIYTLFSNNVNNASDNIIVRIITSQPRTLYVDDFYIGDYPATGMAVLGTNMVAITSGEAASTAKGTDFGSISLGATLTNTLSITNNGNLVLNIAGVTTNGTGASSFRISDIPSSVSVGAVSNMTIICAPAAGGAITAAVNIAHDGSNTPSPYVLYVKAVCG